MTVLKELLGDRKFFKTYNSCLALFLNYRIIIKNTRNWDGSNAYFFVDACFGSRSGLRARSQTFPLSGALIKVVKYYSVVILSSHLRVI